MINEPVHRWYTSVMAFPPNLARKALKEMECDSTGWVLDPFCGTGTTLVEAGLQGLNAIGVDANPFMRFCSEAKTSWAVNPKCLSSDLQSIYKLAGKTGISDMKFPDIVGKGWVSEYIWAKASTIHELTQNIPSSKRRNLVRLAIISAVKQFCANVAFGPEIYKKDREKNNVGLEWAISHKVEQMAADIAHMDYKQRQSTVKTFLGDTRDLSQLNKQKGFPDKIKWVITSPPYPAEHDYARITRLELELGDFVDSNLDVRQIRQNSIGSTTKTIYTGDTDWEFIRRMKSVTSLAEKIERKAAKKEDNFSRRYHQVVLNYFGGLSRHLDSLADILETNALCMYVLSDQRSYFGILVPTNDIFIEIATKKLKRFRLVNRTVVRVRKGTRGTSIPINEEAILLQKR